MPIVIEGRGRGANVHSTSVELNCNYFLLFMVLLGCQLDGGDEEP